MGAGIEETERARQGKARQGKKKKKKKEVAGRQPRGVCLRKRGVRSGILSHVSFPHRYKDLKGGWIVKISQPAHSLAWDEKDNGGALSRAGGS